MQQFSEEELRKYNGKDGMPAYIAFKNQVYDVTSSKFWQEGSHFKKHFAGCDLTDAMAHAPHSDEVFENYPCIGQFVSPCSLTPENKKDRYRQWYSKYHPHPLIIHFPIALHYFSAFVDILFLDNPSAGYETAVFLSFLIATIAGFFALISGVFSWWINYDFSISKPFVIKLIGALFTLIVGLIPLGQKLLNPNVAFSTGVDGIIYHAVIFMTVISITIVGYYGGKITWGAKK
ncbi:cytochrome b5 domain-containing protein [Sulfuricurvum sp. RIFCSPLOWO2_12_FULL_43_24]|uniref:cytochrome b5 domain-containing protein n=1 Tax=Sulfuricurvum sp. RIFCSPLOWO2_12_FULL_43_24 TaxID=1802247 RepID=UPI0008AA8C5D|nr:cytochrome b5 domain-containing protein [Sulfuricurvum sp. RIFCSPLOWO2_12_FULL_43_24]OHD88731.1 MAG: hypothetical protein A3G19_09145 [Sulfuricurvum sp. RIFCSPLOWO2_12_FULL_43_24]